MNFGELIFSSRDTYPDVFQEFIVVQEDDIQVIAHLKNSQIILFRIEYQDSVDPTYTHNTARYNLLDAMTAYQNYRQHGHVGK